MVRHNLQGHEECRQQSSRQALAPIAKHHTCDGRRNIGQGDELPDVTGRNDDEEVGRECPDDGSEGRHPCPEVESTQQDVEAEQHHEHIPHVGRQVKMIQILDALQQVRRVIAGCHLIGRHPTEDGVCPAGTFAGTFQIFLALLPCTDARHRVMLAQDASFGHCRTKIHKRDDRKHHHGHHIRNQSLPSIHKLNLFLVK